MAISAGMEKPAPATTGAWQTGSPSALQLQNNNHTGW